MTVLGASILLLISCILIWISSDKTVEYANKLSTSFNVGGMFLGFIGIAFFTGLPELFVAIESLMLKQPLLSAGNLFGSQLVVLTLALGIPLILSGPLVVSKSNRIKSLGMMSFNLLSITLTYLVGQITPVIGIVLIGLYLLGACALYKLGVHFQLIEAAQTNHASTEIKRMRALILCLASIFLLVIASRLCVESGIALAAHTQLPVWLVGTLFFSIATSAPEILVNVQALRKKRYSLALGNSLGSAFQSAALVMGILATGSSEPIDISYFSHLIPCFFLVYGVLIMHLIGKRPLSPIVGLFLTGLYLACMSAELLVALVK